MAVSRVALYFLLLLVEAASLPEQGYWEVKFDKNNTLQGFSKSMYQGTSVAVMINCRGDLDTGEVQVKWILRMSPCATEYAVLEETFLRMYLEYPQNNIGENPFYKTVEYISFSTTSKCGNGHIVLPDWSDQKQQRIDLVEISAPNGTNANSEKSVEAEAPKAETLTGSRKKREATSTTTAPTTTTTAAKPIPKTGTNTFAKAWTDAYYLFVLEIKPVDKKDFKVDVVVQMKGPHGYLSAVDWPLLIFYGVMGLVYIAYGIAWLVMLTCNWRDLLHVQFWIGAVIFLGMLENAVFFAEYESINKTGTSVNGAIIFAELVSCLRRTLARMLLIFLSLGFGIVKPRLGHTFHKVLCVGALFFILGSVEGCFQRLKKPEGDASKVLLVAIPLSLLDIVIICQIVSSLIRTYRTLKLLENTVKLSVYRYFTDTLIFSVLASLAFMIWSITHHKMKTCLTDWKELWVDDAFWHLLFSILLLIIMILWRPTAYNQRYAFSPLVDADIDESEDTMKNRAIDLTLPGLPFAGVPSTVDCDIGPVTSSVTAASPALKPKTDLDILGHGLLPQSRL